MCRSPSVVRCVLRMIPNVYLLVYSTSNQENTVNQLLYPGFVEEIVDAIRLNDPNSRYAVCNCVFLCYNYICVGQVTSTVTSPLP